jgi:hypothetical protein
MYLNKIIWILNENSHGNNVSDSQHIDYTVTNVLKLINLNAL